MKLDISSKSHENIDDHFNPIALKNAKTVYNIGLSECNRVQVIEWI